MSVLDIVDLTIIVASSSLSRPNFGTPLALISKCPSSWGVNMVREFSKLSEVVDAGFSTTSAGYKLAAAIKSQKPCPKTFKFAKRAAGNVPAQSLELSVASDVEGAVYTISVGVDGGALTDLTYTVLAGATLTTVGVAIEALIEAVTGVSSSVAVEKITITPATAGTLVNLASWSSNFHLFDATPDPGVAEDLAAALLEDPDFYGVLLDSNSEAEAKAGAAWCLSNGKLFGHSTSDYGVQDSGTTSDVCTDIQTLANSQAFGIFDGDELLSYAGAAFMARGLAFAPGKATWAFKDLPGISTDYLVPGVQNVIEGKDCNYYVSRWGKPITYPGKLYNGEYIDVTHFLNWLDAEMQIQVFNTITLLPKQPYTNSGLGAIEATVMAVLEAGVRAGGLVAGSITVTMPKLDDIDAVTRASRMVPDIEFDGILAGAIHGATLVGLIRNG